MVQSSVGCGVSAAILAGGRARRFGGADKASLSVGRVRIIDRQLAALAAVSGDIRIVANHPERYAGLGVRVIADLVPGAGPLGGLYTALLDAVHDRMLIVACDLPFVTAALFQRLAAESGPPGKIDADIDAVVPRSARGVEPLCALYLTRCAAAARARIDRGDLRVAGWLADLHVRELGPEALAPYDDGSLFENVNTPHDHARARGWVELNEKPFEDRITE
ncbi:MAG TPA: molybdenum cofactor guanylyltransferase [Vicinamibacterales bacterium]